MNMNVNSNGSVIPVKNATIDPAIIYAQTADLCSFSDFIAIAIATAGNPNIIVGKKPAWYIPICVFLRILIGASGPSIVNAPVAVSIFPVCKTGVPPIA